MRRRKGLIYTIIAALVILAIGVILLKIHSDKKYNNPGFQSYKSNLIACESFFGGNHQTDAQIYVEWKENAPIGC